MLRHTMLLLRPLPTNTPRLNSFATRPLAALGGGRGYDYQRDYNISQSNSFVQVLRHVLLRLSEEGDIAEEERAAAQAAA